MQTLLTRLSLAAALLLAGSAGAFAQRRQPPQPPAPPPAAVERVRKPLLDELFERLGKARDEEEANGVAAMVFVNTLLATAAATLSWMGAEWIDRGKPSMLGAASGAVAGRENATR